MDGLALLIGALCPPGDSLYLWLCDRPFDNRCAFVGLRFSWIHQAFGAGVEFVACGGVMDVQTKGKRRCQVHTAISEADACPELVQR